MTLYACCFSVLLFRGSGLGGSGNRAALLILCARQGAPTSWSKSNAHPARGSAS